MRAGGTLITIADASRWATGASVGLLDTQTLLKDGRPDVPATTGAAGAGRGGGAASPGSPAPSSAARFDLDKAIQLDRERPEYAVRLGPGYWIGAAMTWICRRPSERTSRTALGVYNEESP